MKMSVCIGSAIQKDKIIQKTSVVYRDKKSQAILLGNSGERLKTFQLTKGDNELSFDEFSSGTYTLRIESGNEVTVKQIIIR